MVGDSFHAFSLCSHTKSVFRFSPLLIGEWPRLPLTARIERAPSERAHSASLEDDQAAGPTLLGGSAS